MLAEIGDEPGLHPADLGDTVRQARELADSMEGDLGIVGACLDRQITATARFDQLITGEMRHIHQCCGPLAGQAIAVLAILDEQSGTESESHRQL